jgi:hypothetical protein
MSAAPETPSASSSSIASCACVSGSDPIGERPNPRRSNRIRRYVSKDDH